MTAQESYKHNQAQIQELIKKIQTGLKAHSKEASKAPRNWGYSGDLAHYKSLLQDISDSLNHEGEYAEVA